MHPRRFKKRYILGGFLALLVMLGVIVHLYLNVWLLHYVNRILQHMNGYEGSVEHIESHLYRGAYRIDNLKILKKTGQVPTPFIAIDRAELSLQWKALFHGRIVASADLQQPVVNFAVSPSGTETQTGRTVDWLGILKKLMPFDFNSVTFHDGTVTYQDFSTSPKVDIYMHHMNGEVRNLRNVVDNAQPLPSTLAVDGDSIGGGALAIRGRMNILAPVPDMDITTTLEHVHMPALSNYSNAYAAMDIKDGNLNVYSEFIVKNNRVSGYIKPIATHVSLIDLHRSNPVQWAWETVVAAVMQVFTNVPKDQFATRIPLSGTLTRIDTDSWATLGGIIRNAFVNSFKNGLDKNDALDTAHPADTSSDDQ